MKSMLPAKFDYSEQKQGYITLCGVKKSRVKEVENFHVLDSSHISASDDLIGMVFYDYCGQRKIEINGEIIKEGDIIVCSPELLTGDGTLHEKLFHRVMGADAQLKDFTLSGFARYQGEWRRNSSTLNDNIGPNYARPNEISHPTRQMSDYEFDKITKASEEFLTAKQEASTNSNSEYVESSDRSIFSELLGINYTVAATKVEEKNSSNLQNELQNQNDKSSTELKNEHLDALSSDDERQDEDHSTVLGDVAHYVSNVLGTVAKGLHMVKQHLPGPLHYAETMAEVCAEVAHNHTTGESIEDMICGLAAGVTKVGVGAAIVSSILIPEVSVPLIAEEVGGVIVALGAGASLHQAIDTVVAPCADTVKKSCHTAFANYRKFVTKDTHATKKTVDECYEEYCTPLLKCTKDKRTHHFVAPQKVTRSQVLNTEKGEFLYIISKSGELIIAKKTAGVSHIDLSGICRKYSGRERQHCSPG